MLVTKDTQESTHKFFAVADIDARAKAAYNANKQLFTSVQHKQRVELVDAILRNMLASYTTAYQTARSATRKRPAHTEVKYDRVIQHSTHKHRELKAQAVEALAELGLDLVYKPRTNSYSVHVD
jgi:leucyl aminopeptidase (aminopeptidase T)